MAKKTTDKGVDSWTSNGYGLKVRSGLSSAQRKALAAEVKKNGKGKK